ncbi:MAG: BatD family protein [Alistipes sp.]
MKGFIAKISFTALFVLAIFSALGAEKVTFEANSPLMVAVGETFRVEFALNALPDDNSFGAPDFKGFDVLAGPVISRGESMQIINGSMSKSINYLITYVLSPLRAGNVTIGSAEVAVNGTTYRTRALPIEVVDEGGSSSAGNSMQSQNQRQSASEGQGKVAKDDILLRAIVSRSSVYKGEPLRVAFKLYTRVPFAGAEGGKMPSFNGFWAQELNADNPQHQRETVNGKVYESQVWREFLLYPQQAGTLTIEPADLTVIAQVVTQNRRSADPFFGGGPEVYNVRRKVETPRISIQVKELPAGAPADFSGAVGKFTMEAVYPSDQLSANSAATYTIKIAGTGNMTFIQAPKLTLPTSFEQYNVKTTESIKSSAAGTSGYRQFEYPFIARAQGDYSVAPVEFSYFNPESVQYITLSSKTLDLQITPDVSGGDTTMRVVRGQGLSKEDVKMLGQDIRFVKLGGAMLRTKSVPFIFSVAYFIVLFGILVLFAMLYIALRRQIRDSHNAALLRGKHANKVAVQRFRAAKKYMTEQNQHAFYEEMLRALWGYMSDKFNIPMANLTKENVREELHKRDVSLEETQRFTAIITKCDEAQYSPMASAQMSDVYTEGLDLISRIESVIKK